VENKTGSFIVKIVLVMIVAAALVHLMAPGIVK